MTSAASVLPAMSDRISSRDSDATVWFGPIGSPGWKATSWACHGFNKELFRVVPGKGVRPRRASSIPIQSFS
jgi:hypothetical protein